MRIACIAAASLFFLLCSTTVIAGPPTQDFDFPALAFAAQPPPPAPATAPAPPPPVTPPPAVAPQPCEPAERCYSELHRGVDNTFNVREANPDVLAQQFQFEINALWQTQSNRHDRVAAFQAVNYGLTDDLFVRFQVDQPYLGEGGDSGAGDTHLAVFWRFLQETENCPSMALMLDGRFPSGDGSSGVDGTLTGMVTKCITDRFRLHFNGWIQTANGNQGRERFDRRDFQWAVGPGMDYQLGEGTLLVANYLNRVNEEYGESNQNLLEVGLVHELASTDRCCHGIKVAADVGLDGRDSTPNLGAKLQYEFKLK